MELPLLRLGLLGFDADQVHQAVEQVSRAATSSSRWEIVPFEDADIWLLYSPQVSLVDNRGLRVDNPDTPQSPLTIYPQQTSRPVAFTQPLPPAIDAVLSIALHDSYACAQALNQFAKALRSLCAHYALGEQIAARQSDVVEGAYHLHFEGRMVAMVDLARWQVALSPDAPPLELGLASWRHRPDEARHYPPGFEVLSLERLMWVYASRTSTNRLPEAFQTVPIHLRRLSVLPQSWLHNDHLSLIAHLSHQPCTMATLARQTRLPLKRLSACLSALYYTGTVTLDPRAIKRGDRRIHTGYGDLPGEDSAQPSSDLGPLSVPPSHLHSHLHSGHSGQSVFDTHSFKSLQA